MIESGFYPVNKPAGRTSHDVVDYMRKITGIKKIGHAGTLDPLATGVLILGIGKEATKKLDTWHVHPKTYYAEITLGARSSTDDAEGEITPVSDKKPAETETRKTLETLVGTHEQMPPDISAKKVGGQRLYALARKKKPIEKKPSLVTIHSIDLLEYAYPIVKIRVVCGTGTYIRSIARDLGDKLGIGGYVSVLKRESIGPITLNDCIEMDKTISKEEMEERIKEKGLSVKDSP